MTIQLRTVGTLSKGLAVKREQRDNHTEIVVCTIGIADAFVDRDQLDELLSLPIGWSTGALFGDGYIVADLTVERLLERKARAAKSPSGCRDAR